MDAVFGTHVCTAENDDTLNVYADYDMATGQVFEAAGYTKDNMPSTPDAFMQALRDIKEKTDAIPLYTNFSAGWTIYQC